MKTLIHFSHFVPIFNIWDFEKTYIFPANFYNPLLAYFPFAFQIGSTQKAKIFYFILS